MPLLQSFGDNALRAFGFGVGGAASFELISTTVLANSTTASVTFNVSAYASTYKHLHIRMAIPALTSSGTYIRMQLNGDTGTNYARHVLEGTGTVVQSNNRSSDTAMQLSVNTGTNSSVIADGHILDLLDAFSTTKNKTIRNLTGSAGAGSIGLISGLWASTAAVNSIAVLAFTAGNPSTFVTGSRFSIYGVRG